MCKTLSSRAVCNNEFETTFVLIILKMESGKLGIGSRVRNKRWHQITKHILNGFKTGNTRLFDYNYGWMLKYLLLYNAKFLISHYALFIDFLFLFAYFKSLLTFLDYIRFSAWFINNECSKTSKSSSLRPLEIVPVNDYVPNKQIIRLL